MQRDRSQDAYHDIKNGVRPGSSAFVEYIDSQNQPNLRLFCFVEGKTDKKFYKNSLPVHTEYKEEQIAYISNGDYGGKDSVYEILLRFSNNTWRLRPGTKNVFIIDRDYEGIKSTWINEKVVNNLTVLPCYSIENYYFAPESNLTEIFKHYFHACWKEYLAKFYSEFNIYIEAISQYCAWKSICAKYPEKTECLEYKNRDSTNDPDSANYILNGMKFSIPFSLETGYYRFVEMATHELLDRLPTLYCKMLVKKDSFSKDLRLPKGKLLFEFLKKYLKYEYADKDLKELEEELFILSGKLQINLDLIEVSI